MTKKMTMVTVVMLAVLFMVGSANAGPDIQVLPDTGGDVINIPVDGVTNAYALVGLEVDWTGWTGCSASTPCVYSAVIYDEDGVPVWSASGSQTTSYWIETADEWVPANDLTKSYTLYADGHYKKFLKSVEQPIAPVPEVSTIALTSAGVLGLLGLVRIQRKH